MLKLGESSKQITSEEMEAIIKKFPHKLPKEFIELYTMYNGGVPDKNLVKDGHTLLPVHEFYNWPDIAFFTKDLDEYSVPTELDHTKAIPFACDQGGNTYALYFEHSDPKVYFYTTSDQMTTHGKWESFREFIESFSS